MPAAFEVAANCALLSGVPITMLAGFAQVTTGVALVTSCVTVHVNDWLCERPPSDAVAVTWWTPALAAVKVPEMRPVAVVI